MDTTIAQQQVTSGAGATRIRDVSREGLRKLAEEICDSHTRLLDMVLAYHLERMARMSPQDTSGNSLS